MFLLWTRLGLFVLKYQPADKLTLLIKNRLGPYRILIKSSDGSYFDGNVDLAPKIRRGILLTTQTHLAIPSI